MKLLKTYQKFIASIVGICFLFSSVTPPPRAFAQAPVENLSLSLVPLGIPRELASIKEAFLPNPKAEDIPLIHIQSVHAHTETQKKIYELLKFLDQKYGVKAMFIEGAGENLNPDYFRFFDENRLNVRVAQNLVEKGELTGAELFLVESQKKIPAYGIEVKRRKLIKSGIHTAPGERIIEQGFRRKIDETDQGVERPLGQIFLDGFQDIGLARSSDKRTENLNCPVAALPGRYDFKFGQGAVYNEFTRKFNACFRFSGLIFF